MLHKDVLIGDNHFLHQWEFANSTARAGLVPIATDAGKVAKDLDTNSFWILSSYLPITWERLGITVKQDTFAKTKINKQEWANRQPALNQVLYSNF